MKTNTAVIICAGLFASSAHAATDNFDDAKTGPLPSNWNGKWTGTQTGDGAAKWRIEKDDTAPSKPHVLAQRGEAQYPVALKNDALLKNGFVEVKFKPVAGKEDQAGGVVWRARDAHNYYIARANALEDNVTIYHTIDGRRVSFKSIDTKVVSGVWHTLRADFQGNQFVVTYDGHKVIEASDDSFKDAGKVGVWTKADSVTLFDDFHYGEK
jgi:hypothetical protein